MKTNHIKEILKLRERIAELEGVNSALQEEVALLKEREKQNLKTIGLLTGTPIVDDIEDTIQREEVKVSRRRSDGAESSLSSRLLRKSGSLSSMSDLMLKRDKSSDKYDYPVELNEIDATLMGLINVEKKPSTARSVAVAAVATSANEDYISDSSHHSGSQEASQEDSSSKESFANCHSGYMSANNSSDSYEADPSSLVLECSQYTVLDTCTIGTVFPFLTQNSTVTPKPAPVCSTSLFASVTSGVTLGGTPSTSKMTDIAQDSVSPTKSDELVCCNITVSSDSKKNHEFHLSLALLNCLPRSFIASSDLKILDALPHRCDRNVLLELQRKVEVPNSVIAGSVLSEVIISSIKHSCKSKAKGGSTACGLKTLKLVVEWLRNPLRDLDDVTPKIVHLFCKISLISFLVSFLSKTLSFPKKKWGEYRRYCQKQLLKYSERMLNQISIQLNLYASFARDFNENIRFGSISNGVDKVLVSELFEVSASSWVVEGIEDAALCVTSLGASLDVSTSECGISCPVPSGEIVTSTVLIEKCRDFSVLLSSLKQLCNMSDSCGVSSVKEHWAVEFIELLDSLTDTDDGLEDVSWISEDGEDREWKRPKLENVDAKAESILDLVLASSKDMYSVSSLSFAPVAKKDTEKKKAVADPDSAVSVNASSHPVVHPKPAAWNAKKSAEGIAGTKAVIPPPVNTLKRVHSNALLGSRPASVNNRTGLKPVRLVSMREAPISVAKPSVILGKSTIPGSNSGLHRSMSTSVLQEKNWDANSREIGCLTPTRPKMSAPTTPPIGKLSSSTQFSSPKPNSMSFFIPNTPDIDDFNNNGTVVGSNLLSENIWK